MKEEMLSLHEEDRGRWSVTTLSARFRAPRENVEALLKLGRVRNERAKELGRLNEEERKKVDEMSEGMVKAWMRLAEVDGGAWKRGGRGLAEASELAKGEASAVAAAAAGGGGEEQEEEEVGKGEDEEMDVVRKKSRTAEWVEKFCEDAERDVCRRSSFAFIEVGGKGGDREVERAVWIREGASGVLRVADPKEREVLLEKVRVVDSGLWQ